MRKEEQPQESLRQVGLILVGYALAKGDARKEVLGAIAPEDLVKDCGDLLEAIRDQEAKPLKAWLEKRGGSVENGADFIQGCLRVIRERATRSRLERTLQELSYSFKIEPVECLPDRLREAAERLERSR